MDNLLNQFKLIYKKDKLSILLIVFISFCFKQTHLICVCVVSIISLYKLIQVKTKKIDSIKLCKTYFYLLVYSLIFTGSITKTILVFLLIFIWIIPNSNTRSYKEIYAEKIIVIFFGLILLNHVIFKPFLYGLDVYIHYLLVPLVFIGLKFRNIKISTLKTMEVFVSAMLVASFLLFSLQSILGNISFKVNTFFSKPLNITHVYYGMFLGGAICFLLILEHKKKHHFYKKHTILIIPILLIILVYIGARVALIASLIVLISFIISQLKINHFKKISLIILIISSLYLLTLKNSRVQQGIKQLENVYASINNNDKEDLINNSWRNMYKRFLVTQYTIDEIKKHPILGIGLQNVREKISTKIINDGYKYFKPINTHNQYLHFLVGMGVLGFLYFIGFGVYLFKNSENIYRLFYIFIGILSLTESLLVREKGIAFFLIFSLILLNQNDKNCSHS